MYYPQCIFISIAVAVHYLWDREVMQIINFLCTHNKRTIHHPSLVLFPSFQDLIVTVLQQIKHSYKDKRTKVPVHHFRNHPKLSTTDLLNMMI